MKNLLDLFIGGIRDLYYAEKAISLTLPKMIKNSTNLELKNGFENHLVETETHIKRLEKTLEILGLGLRGKKCPAIDGILEEGKELMEESETPEIMDVALSTAAHKVEHYEIASYRGLIAQGQILGHDDIVALLQDTLDEEEAADKTLNKVQNELFKKAL